MGVETGRRPLDSWPEETRSTTARQSRRRSPAKRPKAVMAGGGWDGRRCARGTLRCRSRQAARGLAALAKASRQPRSSARGTGRKSVSEARPLAATSEYWWRPRSGSRGASRDRRGQDLSVEGDSGSPTACGLGGRHARRARAVRDRTRMLARKRGATGVACSSAHWARVGLTRPARANGLGHWATLRGSDVDGSQGRNTRCAPA